MCIRDRYDVVMLSGYQFMLGGVILSISGSLGGGTLAGTAGFGGVLLLCYMGFLSAAAYTIWGMLLKYNPMSKVTIFGFMTPMFGVLLSAAVLGETGQALSCLFYTSYSGIPAAISTAIMSVSENPYVIFLLMNVILLIVGMFMDITPAILIFTPIFLPIAESLGMSNIQFGVMRCV